MKTLCTIETADTGELTTLEDGMEGDFIITHRWSKDDKSMTTIPVEIATLEHMLHVAKAATPILASGQNVIPFPQASANIRAFWNVVFDDVVVGND